MNGRTLEVMLVEDNDEHEFLTKQALLRSSAKIDIVSFDDGKSALRRLRKKVPVPAFLLLDLDMSALDGLALMHQIRRQLPEFAAPILLLTETLDEERIRQAYRLGAAGYINKPLNNAKNLSKLQNYLDMLQIPVTVWPYAHIPSDAEMIV